MIRRALGVGLFTGLLLSLAGFYPAISLIMPIFAPELAHTVNNDLLHGILLMASATIGVPAFLAVGILAVRRANVQGIAQGAKVGTVAGAIIGSFIYITLVAPINALTAYGKFIGFVPHDGNALPSISALHDYANVFQDGVYLLEITLFLAILFWGTQGAILGWRRRHVAQPKSYTLYETLAQGHSPRFWMAHNESTIRAGLLVGIAIGWLLFFTMIGQSYLLLVSEWPELEVILQPTQLATVTASAREALPLLWPIIMLGLITFGGLVVAFSKNPPSRFWSRLNGILVASHIIFTLFVTLFLRLFYLQLGLLPFSFFRQIKLNPELFVDMPPEIVTFLYTLLDSPSILVSITLAAPWIFILIGFITSMIIGGMQALFYGLLLPYLHPQPVDKAASLVRHIKQMPKETLPTIYYLFSSNPDAYDILAHLAVKTYKHKPEIAQLAAAYHTLGTTKDRTAVTETVQAIQSILKQHPDWRWAIDMGAVYSAISAVLTAQSLDQLLAIEYIPEQHTTSLPPMIVQGMKGIGTIVQESHKIARVQDMPTKLIFLDNTLEAIHIAERFVTQEMGDTEKCVTFLPELTVFSHVLDHWQSIVLKKMKHIKGRAHVISALQSQQSVYYNPLPLALKVRNDGLNVAQQVRLRVLPGPEYRVAKKQSEVIEILPPGEDRMITIPLNLRNGVHRLRVEWEIVYDDAVDDNRQVSFADVVEFTEPDTPFERIFPIPYVTGTPLKTNDVFVGREDVFDFIKENLLGAHQNNVIILHGQRRTGKTSVLYRLGDVMSNTHYGVLIDMQGKPARSEADFLYSIADDIIFTLEDYGIEIDLPERADFIEAPEFFFRSRFLRGLHPHLGDKNLLLMFDEFEELQRRVEDGRLQPEIFQFLRNLMQHDKKVDFVFSGTHKLEDLGAEYWSVLFNIAAYKPITFLSYNEVRHLIEVPVANYHIEYDPLAVDRIMDVTAGHPYFTQLVLHEMIVYHNEMKRSYLTVTDVDIALERIVERGEAHFKYIWAESSEAERLVLQAITELLVSKPTAHINDLSDFLHERGYQSNDNWQRALANLEGRDILTRPSVKNPLYHFKVEIIRLWIERTRPAT